MYEVKARYYASPDQFGETFVLTSDNGDIDLRLEVGTKVKIVPMCRACGEKEVTKNQHCDKCGKIAISY